MTRVNSAINVKCLTDEHLLAEHREIIRLPSYYKACIGRDVKVPDTFRLGRGHVKFFLYKQGFLRKRYREIFYECLLRGFEVTYFGDSWLGIDRLDDYCPTDAERLLLVDRISERLLNSRKKYWHYCGKRISAEDAVELLTSKQFEL